MESLGILDDTGPWFFLGPFNPSAFLIPLGILIVLFLIRRSIRSLWCGLQGKTRARRGGVSAVDRADLNAVVERIGTGGAGTETHTCTAYRSSLGVRLVATFGIAMLAISLCPELPGEELDGFGVGIRMEGLALAGAYSWYLFAALLAFAAFYLRHIWTYEIEIDGPSLTVPKLGTGRETHDLRHLDRIEDGGRTTLRLYFDDGRKTDLLKHLRGMDEMIARLNAYRQS